MVKIKAQTILRSKIPFKNYLAASLLLAFATGTFVLLFQGNLPPEVPLFYGAAEGETQVAPSWMLIFPSVFSILTIVGNFFLTFLTSDEFIKKVLVISALVVTLFSVVTTLKIIFLVS